MSDSQFLTEVSETLDARQAPADRVTIIAGLARLANHFRADRPTDAWQMLFEDYSDDLMGISEGHLQTILTKQRQDSPWFPKSADLVAAWDAIRLRESEQLRRARVLLGLEAPKPWERAQ